jgi:hypothetical protein
MLYFCFLSVAASDILAQGVFISQVSSPTSSPVSLVSHGEIWRFHKGTNAPAVGWQIQEEAALDATWGAGAGGFGFADNASETANCQTLLPDMINRYSTLYVRRSFEITGSVDPTEHLLLTMDWDDGFVAYLDGIELRRANAPGAVGLEPGFAGLATAGHESSRGAPPANRPVTFDLGEVGNRLQPGLHVLAMMGLNAATNSSDFVLVADLALGSGSPPILVNGAFFSVAATNSVTVFGTNTIIGSARVSVNGVDAAFDSSTGAWGKTQSLAPGFNRLLIEVLDTAGVPLFSTNQDIVADLSSVSIGGRLGTNTILSKSMGIIRVTNTVVVPPGGNLSIGPGCVFLISPRAGFVATNATITATGTVDEPVYFLPSDGATVWGGLVVRGTNGQLRLRHVETTAGYIELLDGADGTLEDSYFHDYDESSPPIIHTLGQPNRLTLNLRRCHVTRYYEILSQLATNQIEDCLFEYQASGGDGVDFDGAQLGSYIRRCTVRHAKFTNVDAIDMGEAPGGGVGSKAEIDSCLLYDCVDKGISMGVAVEINVSNCLIYGVDSAIAVKDNSIATIYNCTIVGNNYGLNCYNKANPNAANGGGHITNSFNNILASNRTNYLLLNGSTLTADFSAFEGAGYPGPGNIPSAPLFVNPAQQDYRTLAASPTLGAGRDGAHLGATFPVGAPMALSHPRFESVEIKDTVAKLRLWVDPEKTYTVQSRDAAAGGAWIKVADVFPQPLPRLAEVTSSIAGGPSRLYRIVTPRQP